MAVRCRGGGQIEHVVHFVPGRTIVCEKVLQEEGVYGDCTLADYPLYFIPFDYDVLSLELDSAFRVHSLPNDEVHSAIFFPNSGWNPSPSLPHLFHVLLLFRVHLFLLASCLSSPPQLDERRYCVRCMPLAKNDIALGACHSLQSRCIRVVKR